MPDSPKKKMPSSLNPNLKNILAANKKHRLPAEAYAKAIVAGDRVILGQAITIIESVNSGDQNLAAEIIDQCLPHANQSIRIGITGACGKKDERDDDFVRSRRF